MENDKKHPEHYGDVVDVSEIEVAGRLAVKTVFSGGYSTITFKDDGETHVLRPTQHRDFRRLDPEFEKKQDSENS